MNLKKLFIFQKIKFKDQFKSIKAIKLENIDIRNIYNSSEYLKLSIYILVCLCLFLVFFVLFDLRILKSIQAEKNKILELKKQYSGNLTLVDNIKSLANENNVIESNLHSLLDTLHTWHSVPSVIEDLNLTAQNNRLKVDVLSYNQQRTGTDDASNNYKNDKLVKQISYSLKVTGSYNKLLKFSYDIAKLNRLFILDNFNINTMNNNTNNLQLSAVVKTYEYIDGNKHGNNIQIERY